MEPAKIVHVYNRGLDKRIIFPSDSYYQRFLLAAMLSRLSKAPNPTTYYKREKLGALPSESEMEQEWKPALVDILAYCLMPNHFHLLLFEKELGGITQFMSRLGDAYTKYYNIRSEREGRLFTGSYKQVKITTDEQLMHVTRYQHRNPTESSYTNVPLLKLRDYPWSSLQNYLNKKNDLFCQPQFVLDLFGNSDYWEFVSQGIGESLTMYPKELFLDAEAE